MSNVNFTTRIPNMEDSEDIILRIPNQERIALLRFLGRFSLDEIRAKGFTVEEHALLMSIYHSLS